MNKDVRRYAKSQGGYTLVELIVASAIGALVMTGLTSVFFTSWRAGTTATSRIEASAQVRNFQLDATDDFALSGAPVISSCAPNDPPPCTITLSGWKYSNPPQQYTVTYRWDGANVDRTVGQNPPVHAATNVIGFSAHLAGSAPYQTVVVALTVQVQTYVETQTMRFYPRLNP
jgi:prepilin-type N-terminal cleavage/methylation domain-containing protein